MSTHVVTTYNFSSMISPISLLFNITKELYTYCPQEITLTDDLILSFIKKES